MIRFSVSLTRANLWAYICNPFKQVAFLQTKTPHGLRPAKLALGSTIMELALFSNHFTHSKQTRHGFNKLFCLRGRNSSSNSNKTLIGHMGSCEDVRVHPYTQHGASQMSLVTAKQNTTSDQVLLQHLEMDLHEIRQQAIISSRKWALLRFNSAEN